MLIQGRFERAEANSIHFKWEVTRTLKKTPNTFEMGQRVNSHSVKKIEGKINNLQIRHVTLFKIGDIF